MDFFVAFLGSILAFVFAFVLYIYQKKVQEGQYLSFTVAYISSQMGRLYSLKKTHLIPRHQEVLYLENQFKTDNPHLKLREIANIISNPRHTSANISLEKLSFIVDVDPNLLVLTKAALDADSGVDEIVQNCNLQIKEVKRYLQETETAEHNKIAEIWLLMCLNKCLYDQVDHALGLLEHTQEQLVKFLKHEFKYFSIIKEFSLDEKYTEFKPKIENSFLEVIYSEKDISFSKKLRRIVNRFKSCI